jgi:pentatricopeptide repeat protein
MKLFGLFALAMVLITTSHLGRSFSFEEKKFLISPPPHIEYYSFGYQASISSLLWIRAIQDFDYCDLQLAKNLCRGNSWLFQTLNAVSRLAPDFQEVYTYGATALSVLVSDIPGAATLFDRGVRMFPQNFNLAYRAGYHALIEEKDDEKAGRYLMQAAKIQGVGGTWLYSLATRLLTQTGKTEVALRLYEEMKDSGLDEQILQRMRERIESYDKNSKKENPSH